MKSKVTIDQDAMIGARTPGGSLNGNIWNKSKTTAKSSIVTDTSLCEGGFAKIITRSSLKDVNHIDSKKWWQEASVRVTDSITFVCDGNKAKTQ